MNVMLVVAQGNLPYFDVTIPHLRKLAHWMQCDFHLVQAPRDGMPTWMKLSATERLLQYKRIIYCDADILPNWNVLRYVDLVPLIGGDVPVMVPDHGIKVCNSRFEGWCGKHLPHVRIQRGAPYFNAGLMSWPAPFAAGLFDAFSQFSVTDEEFHDQDFINAHLHHEKIRTIELPVEMNWMAPHLFDATIAQAKIIHFAGHHKPLIPRYATII